MKRIKVLSFTLAILMLCSAVALSVSAKTTSVSFVTKISDGKIFGIPERTNPSAVELIYYNANVSVYDKNGKDAADTAYIGTGYNVKINGTKYYAVVLGDVDGDGKITPTDYSFVKRAYMGTLTLNALQMNAAGVETGKSLTALNYIMVSRAYFGTYDINSAYNCDPYNPAEDESGWSEGWV